MYDNILIYSPGHIFYNSVTLFSLEGLYFFLQSVNIPQIYSCFILFHDCIVRFSFENMHHHFYAEPVFFLCVFFKQICLSREYCTHLQENKTEIYIWNNLGIPDCIHTLNCPRQMLIWYHFSSLPEWLMVQYGKW